MNIKFEYCSRYINKLAAKTARRAWNCFCISIIFLFDCFSEKEKRKRNSTTQNIIDGPFLARNEWGAGQLNQLVKLLQGDATTEK